jgi:hypothetical protein
MWYYKARMYSPTLGRFLQSDPIGYRAGMNRYANVGGDPVNFVDPSGTTITVMGPRHHQNGRVVELDGARATGFSSSGPAEPEQPNTGEDIVVIACGPGEKVQDGICIAPITVTTSGGILSASRWLYLKGLDVICSIPPIGFGGGIDAYEGIGGTVQGGYSFDFRAGQASVFFSVGVGLGVGGGAFTQGVANAPSGISGSAAINGAFGGLGYGGFGSRTILGSGAGTNSGGGFRSGVPTFGGNINISAGGSIGTPKLYNLGC